MLLSAIHDRIRFIKSQEIGGYTTPGEIDMALDVASLSEFKRHYPNYAKDQNSRDALAPFLDEEDFTTGANGTFTVQVSRNYLHLLSFYVIVQDSALVNRRYKVKIVNEDEEAGRSNSQLRAPTSTNVFAVRMYGNQYQFYPEQAHTGKFRFLRRPVAPVFRYTQAGRVITEYPLNDDNASTQLEWTDAYVGDVIAVALGVIGVNLTDELLIKYGFQAKEPA